MRRSPNLWALSIPCPWKAKMVAVWFWFIDRLVNQHLKGHKPLSKKLWLHGQTWWWIDVTAKTIYREFFKFLCCCDLVVDFFGGSLIRVYYKKHLSTETKPWSETLRVSSTRRWVDLRRRRSFASSRNQTGGNFQKTFLIARSWVRSVKTKLEEMIKNG